jgi:hypothetical protein
MGESKVNLIKHFIILLIGCCALSPAFASDFDGSKALICATVEARDCVLGSTCYAGHAREIGAPGFMRIDFAGKTIKGPERKTPITSMEKGKNQLMMQGTELGYGWAFAINQSNGDFSASMTNIDGTFLLFGSCTPD